jgi:two-component system, OmpR family, sensor histidine kinase SenX3
MDVGGHRKSIAVFVTLGVITVALAVALNVSWIVVNWRTAWMLFLGVPFFLLIIAGVVLNTIFLVREIRRNEQHNSFINAVTHELKTPVASIRLYLETLRSREVDDARRQDFYRIMLEDSDRLLGTIEQVLSAGRTSRSSRKLQLTPVDLREMVRDCLALARTRHHLPEESIDYIEKITDPKQAQVMGDLEELKAAISNLLDNAIKYSGSQVRILVEVAAADPKGVSVVVHDHGVGIPRHELKRVFERFYRVPGVTRSRVPGAGLGLSIVASVARKHGGKVEAASEGPDKGSTFTLTFPSAQ